MAESFNFTALELFFGSQGGLNFLRGSRQIIDSHTAGVIYRVDNRRRGGHHRHFADAGSPQGSFDPRRFIDDHVHVKGCLHRWKFERDPVFGFTVDIFFPERISFAVFKNYLPPILLIPPGFPAPLGTAEPDGLTIFGRAPFALLISGFALFTCLTAFSLAAF